MGMAPYGKPRYVEEVKKLIKTYDDGSFELNMDYFSFQYSISRMFNGRFETLFGKPRDPRSKFFTTDTPYPSYFGEKPSNYSEQAKENEHYADIAASVQAVTEEVAINMANALYRDTGLKKLCIAGGVGLNSVANWKTIENTPFEEAYIQASAGDAGGAIGAALYVYHSVLG